MHDLQCDQSTTCRSSSRDVGYVGVGRPGWDAMVRSRRPCTVRDATSVCPSSPLRRECVARERPDLAAIRATVRGRTADVSHRNRIGGRWLRRAPVESTAQLRPLLRSGPQAPRLGVLEVPGSHGCDHPRPLRFDTDAQRHSHLVQPVEPGLPVGTRRERQSAPASTLVYRRDTHLQVGVLRAPEPPTP